MEYEDLYDKLSAQFKVELGLAIDAINIKRTDTVLVEPQQWYDESLDDEAKSFDFMGFIGTANSTGVTAGRAMAINYEIEIDLFIPDEEEMPGQLQKKLKRYTQALRVASQNTWKKVGIGFGDVELNLLTPISAGLNNSSRAYKLLGIQLKFTMVFN